MKAKNNELITEKEIEILELLVEGKQNEEIAKLMIVSKSTVKAHIKNLYRKFDTRNRVETVVKALKLEFVEI